MTSNVHTTGAPTTYLSRVWLRLRRSRIASFGLWCIAGLLLLAITAPLISHNQPLLWVTSEGWESPFLRSLFNRLVFENGVDLYFNLLLVLGPVYLAGYALLSRVRRTTRPSVIAALLRRASPAVVIVVFHHLLFLTLTPQHLASAPNPFYYTEPVRDYVEEQRVRREQGEKVFAVFPLFEYGYRSTEPGNNLQPPSGAHWLGTDTEGRDVLSRMVYGTRISLTIGVVAVSIYVSIGVVLGALAGYFGGRVDHWISRLIEVMICFPSFFLILTIAALIEQRSIFHVMLIIGVTSWTGVARLIRAEFLKHKNLEYAQAAVALGFSAPRIIFRHILPNAIAPVLVSATFGIATAILIESSLAFLGVGDLTVASWGDTLNNGRTEGKLWLVLAPGFAIFFVVSIFNLVGESLRDALDPKLDS